MLRSFALVIVLSCFASPVWAQTQAAPTTAAQTGVPAVKKPAKARSSTKPAGPAEAGPCQIGVIPVTGNQFGVQKVGFTVFGNEYKDVPIGGWRLDDIVVARVRAAAPGFAVRKIAYASDAFARLEQPTGSLFRDTKAELSSILRQVSAGANCERYVLVQKSRGQFSNTNQAVEGAGIVKWGNPVKSRTFLFTLTRIQVYDGRTFEVIKQGAASTDDEALVSRVLLLNPIRGPNRELDEGSFPANPADAAANPAFRDAVRALLTASLDKTLPAMLRQ